MIHARADYQAAIQPIPGLTSIEDDEPVFLLRARDVAAAATVAFWTERAALHGADPILIQHARDWAAHMADWGRVRGNKTPDVPGELLNPPPLIRQRGAPPLDAELTQLAREQD